MRVLSHATTGSNELFPRNLWWSNASLAQREQLNSFQKNLHLMRQADFDSDWYTRQVHTNDRYLVRGRVAACSALTRPCARHSRTHTAEARAHGLPRRQVGKYQAAL